MNIGDPVSIEAVDREHVLMVLQRNPCKKTAAKILGIDRGTLDDKCRRWGFTHVWRDSVPPPEPASAPPAS